MQTRIVGLKKGACESRVFKVNEVLIYFEYSHQDTHATGDLFLRNVFL